jgi:lysylphosphatidylglycerol synthetase-like protein (DUF2156 family)
MKFFSDIDAARPFIETAIRKYGYAPEHNYWWYKFYPEKGDEDIFVSLEEDCGLLTFRSNTALYVFSEPLAPPEKRIPVLLEYLHTVLDMPGIKRAVFEIEEETRKALLKALPPTLHARSVICILVAPIVNLEEFDPALAGGRYKHLRNAKSKFYREHSLEIVPPSDVPRARLHDIVDCWRKNRAGKDKAWGQRYHNIIDGDFKGTDSARVLVVDGVPAGFNAGWMIPNSTRYSGAIGIHNYSSPDLGMILYLEDLTWLKEHGYKEVDMGGGEKALTKFKSQFCPARFHKIYFFSVAKKS